MANLYTPVRLYYTLDRSEVVEEGDPRAAFLACGEGATLAEEEAERLGLAKHMQRHEPMDAVEQEKARLADAEARGAHYEAQSRRQAIERLEAGEVPVADVALHVASPPNVPPPSPPSLTPTGRPAAPARSAAAVEPGGSGQLAGGKAESKKG